MCIVENIKKTLKKQGITTYEMEQKLGISRGGISRWKNSSPSIDKVMIVADYLNVSVDYLLGKTEIRNYSNLDKLIILGHGYTEDVAPESIEYEDLQFFIKSHLHKEN